MENSSTIRTANRKSPQEEINNLLVDTVFHKANISENENEKTVLLYGYGKKNPEAFKKITCRLLELSISMSLFLTGVCAFFSEKDIDYLHYHSEKDIDYLHYNFKWGDLTNLQKDAVFTYIGITEGK